jgi:hypothetical protein
MMHFPRYQIVSSRSGGGGGRMSDGGSLPAEKLSDYHLE